MNDPSSQHVNSTEEGEAAPAAAPFDETAFLLRFETEDLTEAEVIEGMQHLIDSGTVWQLQGSYGRLAQQMIEQGLCTRPDAQRDQTQSQDAEAMPGKALEDVGPYTMVRRDRLRTFSNGRTLRFVLYGAYNANGLIGSECNGILVLNQDKLNVVADEIAREDSGYHGPSARQLALFDQLMSASFEDVAAIVNQSQRLRYALE